MRYKLIALLFLLSRFVAYSQVTIELPFVEPNSCPGEGCTFGKWVAESSTPAYQMQNDTTHVAFIINQNDTVLALTGTLYTEHLGTVIVQESTQTFVRGDTLYALHCAGESDYLILYKGRFLEIPICWSTSEPGELDPQLEARLNARHHRPAIMIERPVAVWWVRIRNASGKEAWLRFVNQDPHCWDWIPRFHGWDVLN